MMDINIESKENNKKLSSLDLNGNMDLDFIDNDKELFEKANKESESIQQLLRPSLSYWQDAWIRLKKDKKAITSLVLITFIVSFSVLGPFIWKIDPNEQNLNLISQGPSFGSEAYVTSIEEIGTIKMDLSIPLEPETEIPAEELAATSSIQVIGTPNTVGTHIQWEQVEGAWKYVIYRHSQMPTGSSDLGIPLFETENPRQLSYIDSLQLEASKYWYTIVATDGVDEASKNTTIEITPQLAYSLEQAQAIDDKLVLGDKIQTKSHPFGTDQLGRDMLSRLMYGGRISFFIGFFAPLLFILFGTLYGGISGFIGGKVDDVMMRIADFVVALPFLLFMILFYVAFGAGPGESGIVPMLLAMVLLLWPSSARLVRGQVLQLREEGFTQAAKLLGANSFYILLRHMIPNTIGVILVTLTFAIPSAIFTEAFLSFIGMGVAPPNPSWGVMSSEGIRSMLITPHELLYPAIFISLTVLSFNLLGDGLRDALDARMRSRE